MKEIKEIFIKPIGEVEVVVLTDDNAEQYYDVNVGTNKMAADLFDLLIRHTSSPVAHMVKEMLDYWYDNPTVSCSEVIKKFSSR